MRVSGYLIPFPDTGAADLMSDHLEQEVQATGAGRVLVKVSLPRSGSSYARKKVEMFRQEDNCWSLLWESATDSSQEWEEVTLEVSSAGTLKGRLTNMSGTEGQFSLECTFMPQ